MASAFVEVAVPTWSQKIARHNELRATGRALLFDRVSLLCDVYEDAEFRVHCAENKQDPGQLLSDLCEDILPGEYFAFMILRNVKNQFPDRKDWESKGIHKLVVETKSLDDARRKSSKSTVKTKAVPSRKILAKRLEAEQRLSKKKDVEIADLTAQVSLYKSSKGLLVSHLQAIHTAYRNGEKITDQTAVALARTVSDELQQMIITTSEVVSERSKR